MLAAASVHLLAPCSTPHSSGVQLAHPDSWFQRLTHQLEHPGFAAALRESWFVPGTFYERSGLRSCSCWAWPGGVLWDTQVKADNGDGGQEDNGNVHSFSGALLLLPAAGVVMSPPGWQSSCYFETSRTTDKPRQGPSFLLSLMPPTLLLPHLALAHSRNENSCYQNRTK